MTMENPKKVESLASKCRKTIAANIERYPIETLGSLPFMEWEAVVLLKYQMTAPKIPNNKGKNTKVKKIKGSNLLSDGRKFPVFTEKFMKEVEEKNQHFKSSNVTDELVWKDCVDFKFKKGGTSRPSVFRMPWDKQVETLRRVVQDIKTLSLAAKRTDSPSSSSSSASSGNPNDTSAQMKKRSGIVQELRTTPMTVPLLSASGIGKALKKLIKKLRAFDTFISTHASNTEQKTSCCLTWATQLEGILQQWMEIASEDGVVMSNNTTTKRSSSSSSSSPPSSPQVQSEVCARNRHTTPEQHAEDVENIQKCSQWRELFDVLAKREQKLIKKHGDKMRKYREHLEVGRPKIHTATTKKGRFVVRENGEIQRYSGGSSERKLGKLRQEFKERKNVIKGGKAGIATNTSATIPRTSFGSSVSSAMSGTSRKRMRNVALGNGKKMKLPRMGNLYHKNLRRGI